MGMVSWTFGHSLLVVPLFHHEYSAQDDDDDETVAKRLEVAPVIFSKRLPVLRSVAGKSTTTSRLDGQETCSQLLDSMICVSYNVPFVACSCWPCWPRLWPQVPGGQGLRFRVPRRAFRIVSERAATWTECQESMQHIPSSIFLSS